MNKYNKSGRKNSQLVEILFLRFVKFFFFFILSSCKLLFFVQLIVNIFFYFLSDLLSDSAFSRRFLLLTACCQVTFTAFTPKYVCGSSQVFPIATSKKIEFINQFLNHQLFSKFHFFFFQLF